jgi:hypothetical protein
VIYFIRRADGTGPIKIGTTIRVAARIVQLTNQLKKPLHVLGVMEGNLDEERAMHTRFHHLRIQPKRREEWFRPGSDLLEFIATQTRQWQEEDDAPLPAKLKAVLFQCTPEFMEWLRELRRHCGQHNMNEFISNVLIDHAERIGFAAAPHRRRMNEASPSTKLKTER